jgi:hypothetical protein
MFAQVYESPLFWPGIALYIVAWLFVIGFWQARKKESRNLLTFVQRSYLMHKYPFESDLGYDIMSFLGPPVFVIYILITLIRHVVYILIYFVTFLVMVLALIYHLGFKVGEK